MKKKKASKSIKTEIRPPIVTIMGHVDHGKTTLLDVIRKTNEAAKEEGGITQKIGAYQIEFPSKEGSHKITFIDTPGHEAFSAMRARGAKVTDLVVLVVAADDGVKPQTVEAINHAKEAKVPLLVAINKIALPGANIKKVKSQLAKEDVLVEELGGEAVAVLISAKQQKGIDDLLEMIVLLAEMLELRADPQGPLSAVVVESHPDSHKGPVASVIVKNGTLKVGQTLSSEGVRGKVRALINEWGKQIPSALPSTPVEVVGFQDAPALGAEVYESKGKMEHRETPQILQKEDYKELTLQDFLEPKIEKPGINVVIKAESEGSLEAIVSSLKNIHSDQFELKILHAAVGEVNKSDVLLAKTAGASVLSFRLKVPPVMERMAKEEKVLIKHYLLIYELLEEIEEALWGEVTDEVQEKILGRAEVVGLFQSSLGKTIAGVKVSEGRIALNDKIKIYRDEAEVHAGKIKTIKHLKEEVREVKKGLECGLTIEPDFNFEKRDILEITRG